MTRTVAGVLAVVISLVVGCGTGAPDDGELLVFAAASLTDAFAELESAFEADHPEVDVVVHLAGSQQLAAQILQGAPADVFASADAAQMQRVIDAGAADGSRTFAGNRLVIAVERDNPHDVTGPADLARGDLTIVLATEDVPIGAYTKRFLDRAGIEVRPASLELDVRAVLSRVALGEADAGVVYASDLVGREEVTGIPIPDELNVSAEYPIAALEDADPAADRFVQLVLGDRGADILRRAGLVVP